MPSARASDAARLHIDTWIAPSHTQAARVADGSLDLAVCWVRTQDLEQRGLNARLVGADRLYAVAAGDDTSAVRARDSSVLLDDDTTSWQSWNRYAEQLAHNTGARAQHTPTAASRAPLSSITSAAAAVRSSTRPRARPPRCRPDSSSAR